MYKTYAVILFLLASSQCFAQYKIDSSLLANSIGSKLDDNKCDNILDAKVIMYKKNVFFRWKVINDTLPGNYLIYKSSDFKFFQIVGNVKILNEVKSNTPYYLSIEDTNFNLNYNYYHIVKILDKEILFSDKSILEKSCIVLDITKKENLNLIQKYSQLTDNLTSN